MDNVNEFRLRRSFSRLPKDEDQPDKQSKYFNRSPMKLTPTHCTVSGALALVLRVSRVVGIAPLDLQQQDSGSLEIRVSKTAYIYGVVLISVLNIIALSSVSIDLSVDNEHSVRMRTPTKSVVWLIDYIAVVLTNIVISYAAPATMQAMIIILTRLEKISSDINHVVAAHIEKRLKVMAVILISLSVAILIFDNYKWSSYSFHKDRNRIVACLYAAYYCLYFNLILITLQFGLTVLTVNSALHSINDHLDRLCNIIKDKGIEYIEDSSKIERHEIPFGCTVPLKSINTVIDKLTSVGDIKMKRKSPADTIRTLGLSYVDASELIEEMNKYFGVIILILLLTTVIHLIITPYYLLTALFKKAEANRTVMLQSVWCIKHLITLLLLVEPCHWTYQEMIRTRKLTSQLACQSAASTGPFVAELRKLSGSLSLNMVLHTPMGVCTLTRPICARILGAVTTYLVVAIQFNTTDDTNDV